MTNYRNLNKGVRFGNGQNAKLGGRPKGASKRTKLKKLIKDLASINKEKITWKEKSLIYDIYELAIADFTLDDTDINLSDLYFFESGFGIKIGVSKDVNKRLKKIKQYAPDAKVLKVIKNGGKFEKLLHKKFIKLNIKGNTTIGIEWFFKNEDLISFIDETNDINDLVMQFGSQQSIQLLLF